jgi:3-oxoadipate CoA-transferase beta subunit
VSRVYTDLAVVDITPDGFQAVDWVADLSFEMLQSMTGAPLMPPTNIRRPL